MFRLSLARTLRSPFSAIAHAHTCTYTCAHNTYLSGEVEAEELLSVAEGCVCVGDSPIVSEGDWCSSISSPGELNRRERKKCHGGRRCVVRRGEVENVWKVICVNTKEWR